MILMTINKSEGYREFHQCGGCQRTYDHRAKIAAWQVKFYPCTSCGTKKWRTFIAAPIIETKYLIFKTVTGLKEKQSD